MCALLACTHLAAGEAANGDDHPRSKSRSFSDLGEEVWVRVVARSTVTWGLAVARFGEVLAPIDCDEPNLTSEPE